MNIRPTPHLYTFRVFDLIVRRSLTPGRVNTQIVLRRPARNTLRIASAADDELGDV